MNNAAEAAAARRVTPNIAALAQARQNARMAAAANATATEGTANTARGRASAARAAMGEFVSEMAGRGTRAPTEDEIGTLTSMFPNLSREVVVNTLQRQCVTWNI